MADLHVILRLARFMSYFFVAGHGLMGGTYIGLSFTDANEALSAIRNIGMAAVWEYVRVYLLRT
jgi:hypothetical protein